MTTDMKVHVHTTFSHIYTVLFSNSLVSKKYPELID